ncbi:MAG: choice-of-anchor D domain-containing protein [Ignavibacteriae bacterium]|nr:choice-of-anchor D domain-containing protein [Ignavibacteriota bacterium]
MKRFSAFLSIFLLSLSLAVAQKQNTITSAQDLTNLLKAPTNAGTNFYFSFPPCYEDESAGGNNACKVFVASNKKQTVTVEVPGKNWIAVKTVEANDVVEFIIPTGIAQPFLKAGRDAAPVEQVYKQAAVHVFTESPVIVYGLTRYSYTSDGFLALPENALGTEYIVAAYPQYTAVGSGYQLVSETTISAAYDETEVTFVMGGTLQSETSGGLKPGKEKKFTLNKGDVLCFASNGDLQDISGSTITSTKPVGVVSGNQCANVPAGVYACDFICEMEIPAYTWGKEYHVTPFFGRRKNPIIRIFAKEKNTKVYRDGQEWLVIPKQTRKLDDGFVERRSFDGDPKSVVISADKPIYVVEYNSGQSDDNVSSDPFQLVLTPLEQYQKEVVFCTPGSVTGNNNFKVHYINLIYKVTADSTIPDDMEFASVKNGQFVWEKVSKVFGANRGQIFGVPVDGAIYACKQIVLPGDGIYRLRSEAKFTAYGYGFGSYDSYGFPVGTALADIGTTTDTSKPHTSAWVQTCDGSITNASVMDYPEDPTMRSNLGLISMGSESTFNYKFTYGQTTPYIAGLSRSTDWSLNVIDKSKDAHAVLHFADRRGNDTTIIVDYTAIAMPSVSIKDGGDFGLVTAKQDSAKTVTITNQYNKPLTIVRIELEKGDQGFILEHVTLPFILAPGETIELKVTFSNTINATYKDRIGVGDSCSFSYTTALKAEVVTTKPNISARGFTYPTKNANTRTECKTIGLTNTGEIDIIVIGDNHSTSLAGTPFEAVDWNLKYPVTLKPGDTINLQVDFVPKAKGTYSATISFTTNDNVPVSIIELHGTANGNAFLKTTNSFMKCLVNQKMTGSITLRNISDEDAIIMSDNHIKALEDTPFEAVGWNVAYPFTIPVGAEYQLQVDFLPKKPGNDTATIIFYDNNNTPYEAQIIGIATTSTGVNEDIRRIGNDANGFNLSVNPNPIRTTSGTVEFMIPSQRLTELTLTDATGAKTLTLAKSIFDAGNYQVRIPVELLSSGSYTLRMVSGKYTLEKNVVIVK